VALMHTHRWEEIGRTYNIGGLERARNAGATSVNSGKFMSQDAYDRWTYGFTNIELRCSECGDLKVVTAPGDVAALSKEQDR
jgi:hypothetical protein